MSIPKKSLFILLSLIVCVTRTNAISASAENTLWSSFKNFKDKLINFFSLNHYAKIAIAFKNKIEIKRQKYKNAFRKFATEIMADLKHTTNKPARAINPTTNKSIRSDEDFQYEEKNMTAIQLIVFHGYKGETHSVHTKDGYTIEIHRVMTRFLRSEKGKEQLVLLHHGLMGSSDDWLLLGPERALPYLLSDVGYDVWLTNARGNRYSRFHDGNLHQKPKLAWDFSFHEMGYFDLAAVIDYIESRTKNDIEINFIGHSMGGTALLALLSTQPQYNQILKSATLLAPLAFMFEIQGPLYMLASFYKKHGYDSLNFLGEHEFMLRKKLPHQFIDRFCKSSDRKWCSNPLLFLTKGGKADMDKGFLEILKGHIPAKTSSKTIKHYLQLVNSGKFHYYEHASTAENFKKYGTISAPSYDLSLVTLPVILFSSQEDWLCTAPSIESLVQKIQKVIHHHVIKNPGFSHTDFVWGDHVKTLLYDLIIKRLDMLLRFQVFAYI